VHAACGKQEGLFRVNPFKKGSDPFLRLTLSKRGLTPFLALADFAFFVGLVAAALGAELLDVELLGHGAPILVRHVVVFAAVFAAELDEITHENALPFRLEGAECSGGCRTVKSRRGGLDLEPGSGVNP
jgi:hypothetical protein